MGFQFGSASVTGRGHINSGAGCQDAHQVVGSGHGLVACVCDGAGSANRSAEGARQLSEALCQALKPQLAMLDSPEIPQVISETIEGVRTSLAESGPLSEFHATLCGVAMNHHQSLVFHIGDGIVVGVNPDDWSDFVVSEPENGEFAETTYFFTLPGWEDHLRIFAAPKRYRTWFLMSDGAASFAVQSSPWRPTPNFMVPVHHYLAGLNHSEQRDEALKATLESSAADGITADDKTLVWLNEAE